MQSRLLGLTVLTLGGCSATYTETSLSADHPASTAAKESAVPRRSRTLDLSSADPVAGQPAEHTVGHTGNGAEAPGGNAPAPSAVFYACPMHPEVTSDKPDQRCPKCGMTLTPQSASGGPR